MGAVLAYVNMTQQPGSSISVDSEAPGLGIQSVLSEQVGDIWRSAAWGSSDNVYIDLDFGASKVCRLVVLAAPPDGVLPAGAGNWRIFASNVSVGASEAHLSPTMTLTMGPNGLAAYLVPASFSARYVRIRLTGGAGDSYVQLSRVWVSDALITSRAVAYNEQTQLADAGFTERAGQSGERYSSPGAIRPLPAYQLPLLNDTDADWIKAMSRTVGTSRQVFFAPYQESPARSGTLGPFVQPPWPSLRFKGRWQASINIDGDI